jgi:hypothetical protein
MTLASCGHLVGILWAELRARGFAGSVRMVQRAVAPWRLAPRARGPRRRPVDQAARGEEARGEEARGEEARKATPPAVALVQDSLPAPPRGLSPRQAVWLLLRPEEDLTATEQTLRARLLEADEEIRAAHDLIARFLIARFLIARFRHLLRTCCAPAAHLLRTCCAPAATSTLLAGKRRRTRVRSLSCAASSRVFSGTRMPCGRH